ncbi:MAG: sensor histidine kinase KdpD [Anaerolineae bacterium]|nr:sensor histidine kinase KdpD [Anaerolineae bacterium]
MFPVRRQRPQRLLVCVSASPFARELVRTTHQLAEQLETCWYAVYVASSEYNHLSPALQERVWQTLKLAEALGAETATLASSSIVEAILEYAHDHDVTQIIVGRSLRSFWQRFFGNTLVDRLVRESGTIDIHVVSQKFTPLHTARSPSGAMLRKWRWIIALGLVGMAILLGYPLRPWIAPYNLVSFFMLAVVISAVFLGLGPTLLSALLGTLALDYIFVFPYYRFALSDLDDILVLVGLLVVGGVIHASVARSRHQTRTAQAREEEAAALYAFNRDLTTATELNVLLDVIIRHIWKTFKCHAAVWLFSSSGDVALCRASKDQVCEDDVKMEKACRTFQQGEITGRGTSFFSEDSFQYLPLETAQEVQGVLGIERLENTVRMLPEQRRLLEAFVGQVSLALERTRYAEEARQAHLLEASERLQSALLNSISHDLRTPLASITGVLSTLIDDGSMISEKIQRELLDTAFKETERLNRFVGNLLDISRLEANALAVSMDLCDIQDLIGAALRQTEPRFQDHPIHVNLPDGLPLIPLDFVLIEQVLINLLDNANKYAPPNTPLEIEVVCHQGWLDVSVADYGEGVLEEEQERIFEKFYRGRSKGRGGGMGLGLAISRGIVEAHGGKIWVKNRPEGGACFTFSLPMPALADHKTEESV